jgi:dTDP-4-dehydrorhamnose 3,5-epimerase
MSDRFTIRETPLAGLVTITRHPLRDERGEFERLFCERDLAEVLPSGQRIVQVNRSRTTTAGLVRGLHYQRPPHAEFKIVTCLRGAAFDVAVDVRPGSPTRHRWQGLVLAAEEHTAVMIPEGFAHGFQALTPDCELLYFHTAAWVADAEAGLHPLDPALGIRWPLPVAGLSARDQDHPFLAGAETAAPFPAEAAA